jgi:hypothetical protein
MIEFITEYPKIAITALTLCPLAALAIAGLMDAAGLEMWQD